jgi:hypothetical protein
MSDIFLHQFSDAGFAVSPYAHEFFEANGGDIKVAVGTREAMKKYRSFIGHSEKLLQDKGESISPQVNSQLFRGVNLSDQKPAFSDIRFGDERELNACIS